MRRFPAQHLHVVRLAGEHDVAVRMEAQAPHGTGVPFFRHDAERLQVVDQHRAIFAAAREQELVGVVLDAGGGSSVLLELLEDAPDPQVPDLDGGVVAARRYPVAVRAEFQPVDCGLVLVVAENATLFPAVPHLDAAVGAARGEVVAVRMEVDGLDGILVAV